MKQYVEDAVKSALSSLSLPDVSVSVVATGDPSHGDYATSVAFSLSKELKKSPHEVADQIVHALRAIRHEQFDKVEVAGNGFINFTLSNKALMESLSNEHKNLASSSHKAGKVMIEFTDPNPFKEFHIGHLYSNIVGESIARLMESTGAEVRRVNYQGDVGLHVAKAVWGMQQQIANGVWQMAELDNKSLQEKAKFLGEAYALGATAYEEDEISKEDIIEINKQVYETFSVILSDNEGSHRKDSSAKPQNDIGLLYEKGKKWSLDYFESIYKRLMDPKGPKAFDRYYFESEAGPIGLKIVTDHKDIFKESDGAIIFPGEEYARLPSPDGKANGGQGLHTRVFINSLGLPTYEAKELGLAVTKYKDYAFDQSIMITGNEINEYFKVLLKALSLIEPEIAGKMRHLSHGMVRLPEGKMSSRTGNVVTGEWLLDEAVKRAGEKIDESKKLGGSTPEKDVPQGVEPLPADRQGLNKQEISEIVGVGAVKWALLKSSIGKDIEFSFDDSISFEGNSGPYIQYTFVRTQSVLQKSEIRNPKSEINSELPRLQAPERSDGGQGTMNNELQVEERALLVLLCRYSDTVAEAAEKFAPHLVTTYLFELSQSFNNFYQKHPILKPEGSTPINPLLAGEGESRLGGTGVRSESDTRAFRLALTAKVGETIRSGLDILGIRVPERM